MHPPCRKSHTGQSTQATGGASPSDRVSRTRPPPTQTSNGTHTLGRLSRQEEEEVVGAPRVSHYQPLSVRLHQHSHEMPPAPPAPSPPPECDTASGTLGTQTGPCAAAAAIPPVCQNNSAVCKTVSVRFHSRLKRAGSGGTLEGPRSPL